jgi:hypothetical protein
MRNERVSCVKSEFESVVNVHQSTLVVTFSL